MRSRICRGLLTSVLASFVCLYLIAPTANSQDAPTKASDNATAPSAATPKADEPGEKPADKPAEDGPPPKSPTDPTATLTRLMPGYEVFVDKKNKQVVMEGEVCLNRGVLEMFACLKGTKEHESVVAIKSKAFVVHAALLALGAKQGSPAKFEPKYTPASGPKVGIQLYWTDEKGNKRTAKAQNWVRDVKKKQAMTQEWVFAGSGFYVDEETKKQYYLADSGDFICVSNFPSAMLDLPIESSADNDNLLFEAFTENIPPKGTKVTVVLSPEIEKKPAGKSEKVAPAQERGK
jgi:hypothetical protein